MRVARLFPPRRGTPACLLTVFLALFVCLAACKADEPREVSFQSTDGVSLKGTLFGKGPAAGVILGHMYPADQKSWFGFARKLADQGYAALAFDFRGYGESGGEKTIGRIDKDLEGALLFLEPQVKRIFLIGASMGGTASIQVASRKKVAGVVSLSGPVAFQGLDARRAIKEVGAPILLIAAEGDAPAAEAARWFDREAVSPKTLMLLPGAEHGTNLFGGTAGRKVEEAIFRFLAEQG